MSSSTFSNLGDWQALAEVYLQPATTTTPSEDGTATSPTYCLCSRVFIKNYYDVYASTLEKDEDGSEAEETVATTTTVTANSNVTAIATHLPTMISLATTKAIITVVAASPAVIDDEYCPVKSSAEDTTHVHFSVVSASELIDPEGSAKRGGGGGGGQHNNNDDADNDANSCYYSASASHTDNYCSTDEHEHHVVKKGVTASKQQQQQRQNDHNQQESVVEVAADESSNNMNKRPVAERLHSSDSGADISENHLLDKMGWSGGGVTVNGGAVGNETLIEGPAEEDDNYDNENDQPIIIPQRPSESVVQLIDSPVDDSPTHIVHHERNNSLPNVLCPEELATEWETYWNRHGEQLIWASWIEKYSDYIDPAFKKEEEAEEEAADKKRQLNLDEVERNSFENAVECCSTANTLHEKNIFTFDEEELEGLSTNQLNRTGMEIVVSNCSPDGCYSGRLQNRSRTVPGSGDVDLENVPWSSQYRNQLSVDERLLSPRCESVNSSIPGTVHGGGAATDSMTNVTRMTISSGEFCSSKVTSESSAENSMTSSTDYNLSATGGGNEEEEEVILSTHSSSQFYDTIDSCPGKLDPGAARMAAATTRTIRREEKDDAMEVDQYWQVLWEKHFQEQYARHYKEFTEEQQLRMEERLNALSGSLKSEAIFEQCVMGEGGRSQGQSRRSRSVKRLRKSANENLPKLVANLRIKGDGEGGDGNGEMIDGGEEDGEESKGVEENEEERPEKDVQNESNLLAAYGLPTSFGSTKRSATRGDDDDDEEDDKDKPPRKATTLKRSHESDTEEVNRDRIKDAFQLMGFAYENLEKAVEDGERSSTSGGEVVYRKKHIRLHNRALKMKIPSQVQARPKLHIRFDEEGNAMGMEEAAGTEAGEVEVVEAAAEPVLLHSSSDDDSQRGAGGVGHQRTGTMAPGAVNQLGSWMAEQQQQGGKGKSDEGEEEEAVPGDRGDGEAVKKKKRKRKGKITALLPPEIANDKTLMKYWYKRFSLFQMFDQGIRMDRESWFSVTPEKVAAHAAERCRCDLIVDGFCGVGGNAIQFAFTCLRVIAIDIDPKKIEMAKHNANIYGVADRIEFIVGDFFQLADRLKADVVFLSPPWGGPQYMKVDSYDLEQHLQPVAASVMMEKARQISRNVAIFLPRNSNTHQLTTLAGPGGSVEIEQSFLDRKLIALTAYYGELINE